MADREIHEFATVEDVNDDDLLLVSSNKDTYNVKASTLKEYSGKAAESAVSTADEAKATADEALAKANEASEQADTANSTAETAIETAELAKSTADEAKTASTSAQEQAEAAQQAATQAQESAETAEKQAKVASDAAVVAGNSATIASNAGVTASNAKQAVDDLAKQIENMYPELVKDVSVNDTGDKLLITFWDNNTTEIEYNTSGGGLAFNGGYVDDENKLHLTIDGEDIDGFDPFTIPAGSGGGGNEGSRITFSLTSGTSFSVADSSSEALVKFKFTSIDTETKLETGAGTLQIYVGGVLKKSMTVQQGDNSVNVMEYLSTGSNTVKLIITDSYGATATRNCTISRESLTLTWNLSTTLKNSGTLAINLIPTGTGDKTVVVTLDGKEYSRDVVTTSGRRLSKSITGLTHGQHIVEAYCTINVAGTEIASDTLLCAVAQIDETNATPVIAVAFTEETATQFTSMSIPFRVIDSVNPTDVEFKVNGVTVNTAKVDQSEQVWTYRPTTSGDTTLELICGSTKWTHTLNVTALTAPINEVTDNLEYKLDPSAITSLDSFTLSDNFDTINGGLITDNEGIRCLKVMKGDTATISFKPFADDARKSGKALKLIFKVDNCSDFNATAISCMQAGIGLEIKANACRLTSEQSTIEMQTCEGIKSELDFLIQPDNDNRLMYIWEDGSPAKAIQYADGDNITQDTPVGITIGSIDCNVYVYLIRCYSSDLSDTEVKANYIFDGADGQEILSRYNKSLVYDSAGNIDPDKCAEICPNAHVMVFHAPSISVAKTNKVTGTLTHKYVAGGATHEWTAENVVNKVQGTSSAAYVLAGLNHDFELKEGIKLSDGTELATYAMTDNSIPVNYFNFKLNVASSENINNILLAQWYNKFQPYVREARKNDPRVRDTVEGEMALLFYHNTGTASVEAGAVTVAPGETIFYGIGNLNNSKKNYSVFAQNDEDDTIVIEGCNNTSDQNRFKSDDLTDENFDGDGSYEFRYLSSKVEENTAKELWQKVLSFVVACDPEQATNVKLATLCTYADVTYQNDTAEYRKAKFKAEASNYFELDSILFHKLFTLVFCMPDNRAKNLFWGYSAKNDKWHLNFSYDHDTGMGNDNEGGLTLRYGYLDTDTIGTKNVFNAADSTLFNLLDTCFADELRNLYISLENEGCWDFDAFADLCNSYQDMICPTLWVEDAQKKYIAPLTIKGSNAYIDMLNGRKKLQRAQFLKFQRQFMASYFIGNYVTSNTAQIRGYTPTNYAGVTPKSSITITPYCDTFVTVKAGSETLQQRAYAGQSVTLDFTKVGAMNDTEIYPYNAPYIQDIGDISCLYPGYCDLSACTRLKKAVIGSSATGYSNTNFTDVKVTNCEALEELNIENCPSFTSALDIANNIMLKRLYTRGTNVSGVTFASGGKLQEALLNAVISISAKHLYYVNKLTLQSYDSLSTLIVEDSPSINTLSIAEGAVNLARLRLLEVIWTMNKSNLLVNLGKLKGVDDDGYTCETAVLTGNVTVENMSESRLEKLEATFPQLNITVNNVIPDYTVKFVLDDEGAQVWNEQTVEQGSPAERPTDPTKESSISTDYTFAGWQGNFSDIQEDTVIKAQWKESVRKYTVRYYNLSFVIQEDIVEYGGSSTYKGEDLQQAGYIWTGWNETADSVDHDMDIQAVYEVPALPTEIKNMTEYDYIVSDDESDNSAYTYAELYAICAAGLEETYFAVGDKIKVVFQNGVLTDKYAELAIDGFRHYRLENGGEVNATHEDGDYSAFASIVFTMVGVLNSTRAMNSTNTNIGGWDVTAMRKWLNSTIIKTLKPVWRSIIKPVQISTTVGNSSTDIVTSVDNLFLLSQTDVGFSTVVPYKLEVDTGAKTQVLPKYTSSSSRVKKKYNGTGDAAWWWLRSPYSGASTQFCGVSYTGYAYYIIAASGYSVAFSFCV